MIYWVQLAFDCAEPDDLMIFWGHALEHPWITSMDVAALREWRKDYPQYDGHGRIDFKDNRHMPVYMQKVPEPKVGRNRLRLELRVRDVAEARRAVEDLGAASTGPGGSGAPPDATGSEMADVEGNEFTIVGGLGAEGVERAWRAIVFDCLDVDRMVEFWSVATEYVPGDGRCDPVHGRWQMKDGWVEVDGKRVAKPPMLPPEPDRVLFDLAPSFVFNKVEEPKERKNRLHIDLVSTDVDGHRARLEKLGATVQRWDTDHVMLDPEGNEFCLN